MCRGSSCTIAGYAGAAFCVLIAFGCESTPRPRHVLIVTLDTMRADRLPPYGFKGVATPVLDRLAAEGTLFEQAFAPVPLTLPSHAALFTGMSPSRLGVRDNAGSPLAPAFLTLAEALRSQGLTTGAFLAASVLAPVHGLDQGFDTYSLGASGCDGSPRARRQAAEVVDEAVAWLDGRGSEPFLAWVHLYDTHRPYRLPEGYQRGYADPYLAAIAYEDAQIGRLVDYLEARHLLDDTLVVVLGDHGESLGDHGEESHGIFVYQATLHVPLILRGPGVPPRRVGAVVRLTDVMPTILEMFRLDPEPMDGVSLMPLLHGVPEHVPREVYAESLYPQRFGWASLRSLRTDRYKVIDAPRPELFDLERDPLEQVNLFASKPATAAAMLGRLRSFESDETLHVSTGPALDPAAAERLASLGYVSGMAPDAGSAGQALPDPKDMIATFNQISRLQAQTAAKRFAASRCRGAGF